MALGGFFYNNYIRRKTMAGLNKKSVDDINVKGKRVLVRCFFNIQIASMIESH